MLGIIILIILIIALFILIILKGASINKTEEEIRIEDEEQIKYINEWRKKHEI